MSDPVMVAAAIVTFTGAGALSLYALTCDVRRHAGKVLDALARRPRADLIAEERWRAMHHAADRRRGFAPADPRSAPRRRRAS